jgi:hypothetical protein
VGDGLTAALGNEAVGNSLQLGRQGGAEEDGFSGIGQTADEVAASLDRGRIKGRERLVSDEHVRAEDEAL